MNKRSLLLGTIMLAGFTGDNFAKTGFYVGAGIGVGVTRTTVVDEGYHEGCEGSNQAGKPYPVGIIDADGLYSFSTAANPSKATGEIFTVRSQSPVTVCKQLLLGDATIRGVAGYEYRCSRAIYVGVEVRGNVGIWHQIHEGPLAVPDLIEYHMSENKDIVVHPTAATFKNQSLSTKVDCREQFSITAVAKVGFVIPGSDGKASVYLLGGGGVARSKLDVTLSGQGERYMMAILDSAIHTAKKSYKSGDIDDADTFASQLAWWNMLYSCRVFTGDVPRLTMATPTMTEVGAAMTAGTGDLVGTAASYAFRQIMTGATTKSGQLTSDAKNVIKDPVLSGNKWVGVVVGGIGFQYSLNSRVSLGIEYNLSRSFKTSVSSSQGISFDAVAISLKNFKERVNAKDFDDLFSRVHCANGTVALDATQQGNFKKAVLAAADAEAKLMAVDPNQKLGNLHSQITTKPRWNHSVFLTVTSHF
ncbi:MAG: hypothetical protein LBQ43_05055 [Holosporales bacterium]|jgi:hypothetical protein|nr:hypothetical protein [Holosporales bacterium]